MNRIEQNYKKRLSSINAEVQALPAGSLIIRGKRYSHVVNEKETGITKNDGLIQKLCRKKFLQVLKKRMDKNISIISKANSKLANITPKEIIRALPAPFQTLPDDYFYHPKWKKWLALPLNQNSFEGREYETKNGILVRSRAEFMIATLLEEYGILYHYEAKLTLSGKTNYPDFLIINPYTGKVIIWEHFGSLHVPEYEQKMNKKMKLYQAHGYTPFETLIYTFEFNLNTRYLRSVIENIILA